MANNDRLHHPVRPHIADPDMAPSAAPEQASALPQWNLAAPPPPPQGGESEVGFFSKYKFALILSVVILITIIVIMYVYLTRRGPKTKKAEPGPPGGESPEVNIDMDEVNRMRALRGRPGAPRPPMQGQTAPRSEPPQQQMHAYGQLPHQPQPPEQVAAFGERPAEAQQQTTNPNRQAAPQAPQFLRPPVDFRPAVEGPQFQTPVEAQTDTLPKQNTRPSGPTDQAVDSLIRSIEDEISESPT